MHPSFDSYKFLYVDFDRITDDVESKLAEDDWEWWTIKVVDGVDYAVYVKETTSPQRR